MHWQLDGDISTISSIWYVEYGVPMCVTNNCQYLSIRDFATNFQTTLNENMHFVKRALVVCVHWLGVSLRQRTFVCL